eukprot:jgi/Hompol1/654/HPOL_001487-RA
MSATPTYIVAALYACNVRATRLQPPPNNISMLLVAVIAAVWPLQVIAGSTYISVPVNPPVCWGRLDWTRSLSPTGAALFDVDLLANSFESVLQVRDADEPTGQVNPGGGPGGPGGPPPPPPPGGPGFPPPGGNGTFPRGPPPVGPAWCQLL